MSFPESTLKPAPWAAQRGHALRLAAAPATAFSFLPASKLHIRRCNLLKKPVISRAVVLKTIASASPASCAPHCLASEKKKKKGEFVPLQMGLVGGEVAWCSERLSLCSDPSQRVCVVVKCDTPCSPFPRRAASCCGRENTLFPQDWV